MPIRGLPCPLESRSSLVKLLPTYFSSSSYFLFYSPFSILHSLFYNLLSRSLRVWLCVACVSLCSLCLAVCSLCFVVFWAFSSLNILKAVKTLHTAKHKLKKKKNRSLNKPFVGSVELGGGNGIGGAA